MITIARGSITEPDKLGPFMDDERRAVEQLKAKAVMKAVLHRLARIAPQRTRICGCWTRPRTWWEATAGSCWRCETSGVGRIG
jgi:hypothetical protein